MSRYSKLFFLLILFFPFQALAAEKFTIEIQKGDTFYKVFKELNVSKDQSKLYIEALKRRLDLRKITEGQKVDFYFKEKNNNLIAIVIPLNKGLTLLAWEKDNKIVSERLSNVVSINAIKAILSGEKFKPQFGKYSFVVKKGDNLTKILTNAGVSFSEIQNIIVSISAIIDLKKLRPKDKINIIYKNVNKEIFLDKVELTMSGKLILIKRDDFGIFRYNNKTKIALKEDNKNINEKKVVKGDTILGKLKSVGWLNKDAREAVDAFSTIYDPRKIGVGFSIIFPKDTRVSVFAVIISKTSAVLVTKINKNKYLAKKISIEAARKSVSNLKYIPLEKEINKNKKTEDKLTNIHDDVNLFFNANLIEGKIEKGDSLIARLMAVGEKRKDINKALDILSDKMNPNLIRAGSSIIIALGNENEPIRGFFIEKNKNIGFLLKLENKNYTIDKYSQKEARIKLAALVQPGIIERKKIIQIHEEWKKTSLVEPYKYNVKIFTFKNGDTLTHAFLNMKITEKTMYDFIDKLKSEFNPKRLRVGQRIKVYINKKDKDDIRGLIIQLDKVKFIEIFKVGENFVLNKYEQPTVITYKKSFGEIESSLYLAAEKAGLPISVLMEMVRIFSFDVDFQREIRKGDGFEVLYEVQHNQDEELVRNGPINSAVLILEGERLSLYRYEYSEGFFDYFDPEGSSARKALMRTPLDGARITSNFGRRKHPILGYTKMHKGVDFGASRNTPVYAAGDGIVESARINGGYGNYIRIRHNSDYKTAYAHLARFAKFIRKGKRVKQGDIIGYVGSTGRSTGPHLHYEIIFRGKQVNPLKIRMPKGLKLKDRNLEAFILERNQLDSLWNSL